MEGSYHFYNPHGDNFLSYGLWHLPDLTVVILFLKLLRHPAVIMNQLELIIKPPNLNSSSSHVKGSSTNEEFLPLFMAEIKINS